MSTYPRYVETVENQKWNNLDLNAVTDYCRGATANGTFAYPCDFTVRGADGFYEAINSVGTKVYGGTTNLGGVSGTDVGAILVACNAALPNGGLIYIAPGNYNTQTAFIPSSKVSVIGAGKFATHIIATADIDIITFKTQYCAMERIALKAGTTDYTKSLLKFDDSLNQVHTNTVRDVSLWRGSAANYGGKGLDMAASGTGITENHIENVLIWGNLDYSISQVTSGTGWINANVFDDIVIYKGKYGVTQTVGGGAINQNHFKVLIQYDTGMTRGWYLAGNYNVLEQCDVFDFPDATRALDFLPAALINKICNCTMSGDIVAGGNLTIFRNFMKTQYGTFKYSEIGGSATIPSGSNFVTFNHTLMGVPQCVIVTGTTDETTSIKAANITSSGMSIATSTGNVTTDTKVYYYLRFSILG